MTLKLYNNIKTNINTTKVTYFHNSELISWVNKSEQNQELYTLNMS